MKIEDLVAQLSKGQKPVICFAKGIEDLEIYAEPGMRARVTGGRVRRNQIATLDVDYSEFEDFNKPLENADWWFSDHKAREMGRPHGTARETGHYKPQDSIDVMANDDVSQYATVVETPALALFLEFTAAGESSYVGWLEQQVLASRAAPAPEPEVATDGDVERVAP